ncbi:hypothetical protein GCM10009076_02440 [Erythrobacter ramosus]
MLAEDRFQHFGFANHPGVQPRRQFADIAAAAARGTIIGIAGFSVAATGGGKELGEAGKGGRAGGVWGHRGGNPVIRSWFRTSGA